MSKKTCATSKKKRNESNNPKFPIYIVSKGRADTRLTSLALERMNVPYFIVVEEQEFKQYAAVIDKSKILILDKSYQDKYDTCDNLEATKSKGPGAARNFCWDHSIKSGHKWHWVMDDNIRHFFRLNKNLKIRVGDGTILKCMEDFALRYTNVGMVGPNYDYFVPESHANKNPPFTINTRIYSCNLIRNDVPFRWRGRYNEDTDLSLQMLKAGWCTIQFNAFMQGKAPTQTVKGGNDKDFYASEGTLPKSEMQVKLHPDASRLVFKFKRWHHHVDYSSFKKNLKLIRRAEIKKEKGINNYGMSVKKIAE